jgi:acetyl-CoA carboxylase biotin carboxyl carrier protein
MAKKTKKEAIPGAGRGIDLVEVERVLHFMEEHQIEQFEYERDGLRILLKKSSAPSGDMPRQIPTAEAPSTDAPAKTATSHSSSLPAMPSRAEIEKANDLHVIKSPIVGTFYTAASPGAEPFISVGDNVVPGQVLCIIEAMKLMNEIESDAAGEVAKVFAENGNPVEYGEPLFGIRASQKK